MTKRNGEGMEEGDPGMCDGSGLPAAWLTLSAGAGFAPAPGSTSSANIASGMRCYEQSLVARPLPASGTPRWCLMAVTATTHTAAL